MNSDHIFDKGHLARWERLLDDLSSWPDGRWHWAESFSAWDWSPGAAWELGLMLNAEALAALREECARVCENTPSLGCSPTLARAAASIRALPLPTPAAGRPGMMKKPRRNFTAADDDDRCTASVRLRDGSRARCMRRATHWREGQTTALCEQHHRIATRPEAPHA
jgi:hypothetical protein